MSIGIAGIGYVLPEQHLTLEQLDQMGLLVSAPDTLEKLGFGDCGISQRPAHELAADAVKPALQAAGVDPEQVDLFIHATAVGDSALVPVSGKRRNPQLDQFKYSASRLQDELGLIKARTMGLSQLSCASLLSSVWTARALMELEGLEVAVCVNADVFPQGLKREVLYNVVSDTACAVVLKRGHDGLRPLSYKQLTRGYYWDCEGRRNELLASYFPTAQRVVRRALQEQGLTMDDIALVIPHNVSRRSWELLARLLKVPMERVYTDNIQAKAHSIASDNFINLHDAMAAGRLRSGDKVLLFSFGLGAHWAASVVEV